MLTNQYGLRKEITRPIELSISSIRRYSPYRALLDFKRKFICQPRDLSNFYPLQSALRLPKVLFAQ